MELDNSYLRKLLHIKQKQLITEHQQQQDQLRQQLQEQKSRLRGVASHDGMKDANEAADERRGWALPNDRADSHSSSSTSFGSESEELLQIIEEDAGPPQGTKSIKVGKESFYGKSVGKQRKESESQWLVINELDENRRQ